MRTGVATAGTTSIIEARLAGLVHESACADPVERERHERFIISRLSVGVVTLGGLPLYLLWRGVPSPQEYLALICLVAPVVAAVLLAKTGRLALAHAISSAALAGLIVAMAASSGGIASPVAIWLVAVPLEALLTGSRRAAVAASAMAALGVVALAAVDGFNLFASVGIWPGYIAMPVFAVMAIAHAAALAITHSHAEDARQAQAKARDAQDRSLLQAIDDLVTWHDRHGGVLKASPAALKLLGAPPSTLVGRGLFNRVHVPDRPAFLKALSDAAAGDRPIAVKFRLHGGEAGVGRGLRETEGRVFWVEMRAHRMEGEGVVAVTRDITEQKGREEDLEAARASAERADALKGRFLATVSHELRTPLNAIIGFSEILSSDGMPGVDAPRRQEYARIIHESGQHLLEVVTTLLNLSKIESGNFDFVPEAFDPGALALGCTDMVRLRAEQAGITLVRDVPDDLPELVADRRACKQILINLVSNAVKFTPAGGRVTVCVRRERDRMTFRVSDTGIGIAQGDLPRLGDPFFQASSTYDRAHEGTGLGLSVVRGLVGLHRGVLTVESGVGQGTCVIVSLPLDCRTGAAPIAVATKVNTVVRLPAAVTGALRHSA